MATFGLDAKRPVVPDLYAEDVGDCIPVVEECPFEKGILGNLGEIPSIFNNIV